MRGSTFALIGAAALCLSGCGSKREANGTAPENNAVAMAADKAALATDPAQAFADKAASSDAFEIASSRLALDKSGSARVKAFAQQMKGAYRLDR